MPGSPDGSSLRILVKNLENLCSLLENFMEMKKPVREFRLQRYVNNSFMLNDYSAWEILLLIEYLLFKFNIIIIQY